MKYRLKIATDTLLKTLFDDSTYTMEDIVRIVPDGYEVKEIGVMLLSVRVKDSLVAGALFDVVGVPAQIPKPKKKKKEKRVSQGFSADCTYEINYRYTYEDM